VRVARVLKALTVEAVVSAVLTLGGVVITTDESVVVVTGPADVIALSHYKLVRRYIKLHQHNKNYLNMCLSLLAQSFRGKQSC